MGFQTIEVTSTSVRGMAESEFYRRLRMEGGPPNRGFVELPLSAGKGSVYFRVDEKLLQIVEICSGQEFLPLDEFLVPVEGLLRQKSGTAEYSGILHPRKASEVKLMVCVKVSKTADGVKPNAFAADGVEPNALDIAAYGARAPEWMEVNQGPMTAYPVSQTTAAFSAGPPGVHGLPFTDLQQPYNSVLPPHPGFAPYTRVPSTLPSGPQGYLTNPPVLTFNQVVSPRYPGYAYPPYHGYPLHNQGYPHYPQQQPNRSMLELARTGLSALHLRVFADALMNGSDGVDFAGTFF